MSSLKRKHVVFDEQDPKLQVVDSQSTAGPSQSGGQVNRNGDLSESSNNKGKSIAKQRYLIKKARKHRKMVSAKKAAAPKNKNWQPDLSSLVVDIMIPPASPALKSLAKKQRQVKDTVIETLPSNLTEEEQETLDKQKRKEEKRAKRAKRQEEKRMKREQNELQPVTALQELPDLPKTVHEAPSRDLSDSEEVDEDLDQGSGNREVSPVASSSKSSQSYSPPPLIPFPLPTAAPAPSKELLAKQGLPTGLADAEFVDQDLRLPIDNLQYKQFGEEVRLSDRMRKRLTHLGIEDFFAVQTAIMPLLLSERLLPDQRQRLHDYLISAPTGSGKTLAYAVPLIEILAPRVVTRLRALIVLPTRDLVVQVRETLEMLAKGTQLIVGSVSGHHSFPHEQRTIVDGMDSPPLLGGSSKVDILVATPGRLVDHLKSTPNFTLQHLRFLIIDEADRLLNQSFQDWLATVISRVKPPENPIQPAELLPIDKLAPAWAEAYGVVRRDPLYPSPIVCQKLLFSATLTRDPAKVAALGLRWPRYFIVQSTSTSLNPATVGAQFALPQTLLEKMAVIPSTIKPLTLLYLIHGSPAIRSVLIFTKSVESANRLTRLLQFFEDAWVGTKVKVSEYARDTKSSERKTLLADFAAGKVDLLICSDLISRGMDLPTVENVVSYDIPLDMRKYVHRVGRTARAGRQGTAWSLVEKQEALHFKAMLKTANHDGNVKKIKVREEEIGQFRESYEIAMRRLKEHYGKTES